MGKRSRKEEKKEKKEPEKREKEGSIIESRCDYGIVGNARAIVNCT